MDTTSEFLRLSLVIEAHEDEDFSAILRKIADRLDAGDIAIDRRHPVLDENGNSVGALTLKDVR